MDRLRCSEAKGITLVVFTTEGRDRLLLDTYTSFSRSFEGTVDTKILAIDGTDTPGINARISPDVIVQNFSRRGYISSILNVIHLLDSEFFFWLEDDWRMERPIDVLEAVRLLTIHPDWVQIRWSKLAPLDPTAIELDRGVRRSVEGFSANPCLCRTALVREGFQWLLRQPTGSSLGIDGFENVITRWSNESGLICAVFDPGSSPAISHTGYLESTGRQWHMTSSLMRPPTDHLLSFARPGLVRRCWMGLKLMGNALFVAWKQLRNDGAYELAFRFVTSTRPFRKKRMSAKNQDLQ